MKIKLFDEASLKHCKEAFAMKERQLDIVDRLNQMGYTDSTGGELTQFDVSKYMIRNGMAYYRKQIKQKSIAKKGSDKEFYLRVISEVAGSKISDDVRGDVITRYSKLLSK